MICAALVGGQFQSTPPTREATRSPTRGLVVQRGFNPRLPRGRRQAMLSDGHNPPMFQSTPPT